MTSILAAMSAGTCAVRTRVSMRTSMPINPNHSDWRPMRNLPRRVGRSTRQTANERPHSGAVPVAGGSGQVYASSNNKLRRKYHEGGGYRRDGAGRSEERRVGKEWGSTCRYGGWLSH